MRIGRIRKTREREREPRIIVTERQKTEIGRIVIEREITGEGKTNRNKEEKRNKSWFEGTTNISGSKEKYK